MLHPNPFRPGLLAVLLAIAAGAPAAAAGTQHSGEILGLNRDDRTLTLRVSLPEGKEVLVFHVPEEAEIREEGSDRELTFADLKAGSRVSIRSRREGGRRVAIEILVRPGRKP